MFARTCVSLVATNRNSFARFYKQIGPSLVKTKGVHPMSVTAALWSVTKPKHKKAHSPARTREALRLYKKHGNSILAEARNATGYATRRRQRGRASVPSSRKKRKSVASRKTSRKGKSSKAPITKVSVANIGTYTKSVTPRRLSKAESALLAAAYRATVHLPPKSRIAAGRNILSHVRLAKPTGKTTKAKVATRNQPRRRSKAQSRSRRAAKKTKKVTTRRITKASSPFAKFSQDVFARTGLTPSKSATARVQRLWILTGTQPRLTAKGRADVAVSLIRKSLLRKRGRAVPAKPRRAKRGVGKKPVKTAAKRVTKRKSVGRRRARPNPYLKFYRAMVLTGHIPNHPHGARSRQIKQLWTDTKHLKTIKSRINLGRSYATGAIPMPSANTKKTGTTKPKSKKAKRQLKTAAKRVTAIRAAPSPIKFTVPENYSKNPFTAAFVVLRKYAAGANPRAKMHNVSVAWAESAYAAGVKDNRTPRQRIQAAADVLKRA